MRENEFIDPRIKCCKSERSVGIGQSMPYEKTIHRIAHATYRMIDGLCGHIIQNPFQGILLSMNCRG